MLKTKKIIACIIALMSFVSTTAFARELKGCISLSQESQFHMRQYLCIHFQTVQLWILP